MIHVFNMNHYQTTFQHSLYISMDVIQFVLKSQQCEAWPQPLPLHWLIYNISLWLFPFYISIVMKIIVSTQNNHRIYCFSSMRYNQTINSHKYLSSYPSMIRCAPLTPVYPAHTRWSAQFRSQACFPANVTYSLMLSWEGFSMHPAWDLQFYSTNALLRYLTCCRRRGRLELTRLLIG